MEVTAIFEAAREGEAERFAPQRDGAAGTNRRMLWHAPARGGTLSSRAAIGLPLAAIPEGRIRSNLAAIAAMSAIAAVLCRE
jgi:hypothetical protein